MTLRRIALLIPACFALSACETLVADLEHLKTALTPVHLLEAPAHSLPAVSSDDESVEDIKDIAMATSDPAVAPLVIPGKKPELALPRIETRVASRASCPDVRIVEDLNRLYQFTDPAKPRDNQAVSTIYMTGIDDTCSMVNNNIAVDMTLTFAGTIGPRGRARAGDKPSMAYPYFIAITNARGQIIAKDVFAVTMSYDTDVQNLTRTEQIRQLIPTSGGNPGSYRILVGFQLSEQELAHNRATAAKQIEPAAGAD